MAARMGYSFCIQPVRRAGNPALTLWYILLMAGVSRIYANEVGAGDIFWPITPPDRVLWDSATMPAFRGRGIYPQLLQAILRREESEAEKFWVGHRADNIASQRGRFPYSFSSIR